MTELREYRPDDFTSVIELWKRAGLMLSRSDDPDGLRRKAEHDPELFVVAVDGDDVVGVIMGGYDGRRGWIYHLAVVPERQGTGLGSALVGAVEGRLRARGCDKVNLLIKPTNSSVQGFYERLGYGRDDLIFMEKWLIER